MFIIDHDLNLLFSTSEGHAGASRIPAGDAAEMGLDNIAQTRDNVLANTSGGFSYDYYGTPKAMVYFPIEKAEWALAMNVEVEAINAVLSRALQSFDMVSDVVYWTIIFLVVYVAFAQSRSDKALRKAAYYDPLTELPNAVKLKEEVSRALIYGKHRPYGIIIFDIENFKAINEMFGREVGDRVLKGMKPFSETFSEPSLVMARIGGDKFAIFAGNGFFEDIRTLTESVDGYFDVLVPELADYTGTFKIGRYLIEPGERDFEDIMTKVGLAYAQAKTTKGMPLCDYDDTLRDRMRRDAEITGKMKYAMDNEEFVIYLQPKFSTDGQTMVGAEALVRWIEADGTMIFPNEFIPLFERNGFIVALDQYVLEQVCKTQRRWLDAGLTPVTLSVNCSRLDLQNPNFVEDIVATADRYRVPHGCIEIELTESTTIENESIIEPILAALRGNGFKISLDDFGAGYSSLGMLKELRVDTLKMDRSFFAGSEDNVRDDKLVDSVVKLAHGLGMYVVAEGIETAEQVALLKKVNCDAVQGYVYARPMPVSDFERAYIHGADTGV